MEHGHGVHDGGDHDAPHVDVHRYGQAVAARGAGRARFVEEGQRGGSGGAIFVM